VPVYELSDEAIFPRPEEAEESGLLAVGGDLRSERLLLAYSMGIFPWYSQGQPILWFSPDPRMVLQPEHLHVSKSLRKQIASGRYEVRFDTAFARVVRACAEVPRPDQEGTWITWEMEQAYIKLQELGFAHSAEAWEGETLVGGLYGVSLGDCFFGESMFSLRADASKVAFVTLANQLASWGIELIDCQVHTAHLERFGAEEWPRAKFLRVLQDALQGPTRRGHWQLPSIVETVEDVEGEA
jgi:leucyl/phenylalanyl-tRNA--protein transferase